MADYSLGKIYKLVSDKTDKIYVGSCVISLNRRFSKHKCNTKKKCSSRKLFVDGATVSIKLIEDFPCETKNELKIRERYHIINNDCINANKPYISDLLYGTAEYSAEYYTENKDVILKNVAEYRADNKDMILKQKAEYYTENRDAILKKKAEYRNANRDAINKRRREAYAKS